MSEQTGNREKEREREREEEGQRGWGKGGNTWILVHSLSSISPWPSLTLFPMSAHCTACRSEPRIPAQKSKSFPASSINGPTRSKHGTASSFGLARRERPAQA